MTSALGQVSKSQHKAAMHMRPVLLLQTLEQVHCMTMPFFLLNRRVMQTKQALKKMLRMCGSPPSLKNKKAMICLQQDLQASNSKSTTSCADERYCGGDPNAYSRCRPDTHHR